uniref:Uncharacterized protein n=1 Tax=Tanacetum cinerariifolium TaxID=118510 RepID=A0A6L2MGN6_TANCI|nr:hypothetical protein [Tanacetum cinerariifolium]
MVSTRASISKASKRLKIYIVPPKQLFVDLTHDDTKTPLPKHQLSSPSAPNAPLKVPSTKDVPAVYIQQFWKTVKQVPNANDTIRFTTGRETITYTVDMFRDTLKLPVEIPDNPFIEQTYLKRRRMIRKDDNDNENDDYDDHTLEHLTNTFITKEYFEGKMKEMFDNLNNLVQELSVEKTNELLKEAIPRMVNDAVKTVLNTMGCAETIEEMLEIKVIEMGGNEEVFSLYSSAEIGEEEFEVYFQGGLRNDDYFDANEDYVRINSGDQLRLSRSATQTIRSPILRVLPKMITYGWEYDCLWAVCDEASEEVVAFNS